MCSFVIFVLKVCLSIYLVAKHILHIYNEQVQLHIQYNIFKAVSTA